jgi:xylulokinase
MSYAHPVKPYWNLSGIINTTGKAIEWGSGLLGLNNLQDFFALAKESKPGSGGLIFNPYLAGERAPLWDTKIRGSWKGINLSSGRSEFAASILEGIGFAINDVITVMEKTGEKVNNLRVTGKLAESEHLNQIKADITGKEVLLPVQKNAELLGLNIIGACTLGRYASFAEASNVMVKIEKTYQPNINNAKLYNELFEKYKIKE